MNSISFKAGLNKSDILKIINSHLDKNADLLIGIDDPEINQLITVLVEGMTNAIEENNQAIEEQIQELIQDLEEKATPNGIYPLRARRIY